MASTSRVLSILTSLIVVAIVGMSAGCSDEVGSTDAGGDSATDQADDLTVDLTVTDGADADLVRDEGPPDADIKPDAVHLGLVLRGGFVPAEGVRSAGALELQGSFAVSYAAEASSNGDRALEHVLFGLR